MYRYNQKNKGVEVEPEVDLGQTKLQSMLDPFDIEAKQPDHTFICKLITEHFSYKLYDIVYEVFMRKQLQEEEEALEDMEEDDQGN